MDRPLCPLRLLRLLRLLPQSRKKPHNHLFRGAGERPVPWGGCYHDCLK